MSGAEADQAALLAALSWQVEMGADEAIGDAPVDRFAAEAPPNATLPIATPPIAAPSAAVAASEDPVTEAGRLAAAAGTLEELRLALAGFDGCALKKGAQNLVFADGIAGAPLMIVGEAPGRDEDRLGKPFVGRSGQLLDRMLTAIGRDRTEAAAEQAVYITNVLPWRPPQNRDPATDEVAMMRAFLDRHIALAAPRVLLLMGNAAAKTLLETKTGITRLRGTWAEVQGIPALPTFHPAALLRNPANKRLVWQDLLSVRERLAAL
ncbi:MAG: uracil-DNA glycosylase [Pseudomonadota bacterium]